MAIKTRHITTDFGDISYRISGEDKKESIILIHGAVGDSRLFRYQLKYFGTTYKVIAIDLPGHGKSENIMMPTLDTFISTILCVMEAEDISHPVLFGHSMGGGLCLELYFRKIFPVKAMILVATAPILPVPKDMLAMAENDEVETFSDILVSKVFSKRISLLIELSRKNLPDMDMEMVRNDMKICLDMDYTDLLPQISVPVMVVATKGDKVIPYNKTVEMGDYIPQSKVTLFDVDGHVPFFEYGDLFNNAVELFFNSIMQ